jgi:hypothetical protein
MVRSMPAANLVAASASCADGVACRTVVAVEGESMNFVMWWERHRDELLEALKELTGHTNERFTGGAWDRVRAAIKKVEEGK